MIELFHCLFDVVETMSLEQLVACNILLPQINVVMGSIVVVLLSFCIMELLRRKSND